MSGCRISKVTDKRTGNSVYVLPPPPQSDVINFLRQALDMAIQHDWRGVTIAATLGGGLQQINYCNPDKTSELKGAVAQLLFSMCLDSEGS